MATSRPRLIDSLLHPAAYPHAVGDVELLETHISWILLAGDYAYKLKKPVRLAFLDYSTLERRREFCLKELRLNRRLAPELYLDCAAICGTEDSPVIDGQGEPLEYAVRMRRFPQEALLSRLIANGSLAAVQIDLLAREVGEFHAGAAVAAPESPWGEPPAILQHALDNFTALARVPQGPTADKLARLQQWTRNQADRLNQRFTGRRLQGFVRECHGDLHLGNMVWLNGRVLLFDGIEFNDSLRWIDVQSDAGFVAMDLMDRGRADYARRFINAYLEQTGDYAGAVVLAFYVVYRALVRAKVAGIRMDQPDIDDAVRESAAAELQTYVELADRYTQRAPPVLAITHGVSGSGKTTGTQPLVEARGMIRIRSDVERKRLFGIKPTESARAGRGEGIYSPEASRKTYDRIADAAAAVIEAGYPAIVDATFLQRRHRDRFRELADRLGVPFEIHAFDADPATLRARLEQRQRAAADASDADESILEHQLRTREPLSDDELRHVVSQST